MTLSFNLSLPVARECKGSVCHGPEDVAREMAELAHSAQEVMVALTLNTKNRVIDRHVISIGTLDSCSAHPREIFRHAVEDSAASIVVVHSHPSGDPTPSSQDLSVTRRLIDAGRILDIELTDHIVIGRMDANGIPRYNSIRESGMVAFGCAQGGSNDRPI